MSVPTFGEPGGIFDELCRKMYLGAHDTIAVPEAVAEWAEGSFRAGVLGALALVGSATPAVQRSVVRPAIREAVAILAEAGEP